MEKKLINRFLILCFMFMLSACSSVLEKQPSEINRPVNKPAIFVDSVISHSMGTIDRLKLQSLVSTAQPQQWTKWTSHTTGAHFEFASLGIYVNAQGQGCRHYKVAIKRRFLESRMFSYKACRDNHGVWQVIKS